MSETKTFEEALAEAERLLEDADPGEDPIRNSLTILLRYPRLPASLRKSLKEIERERRTLEYDIIKKRIIADAIDRDRAEIRDRLATAIREAQHALAVPISETISDWVQSDDEEIAPPAPPARRARRIGYGMAAILTLIVALAVTFSIVASNSGLHIGSGEPIAKKGTISDLREIVTYVENGGSVLAEEDRLRYESVEGELVCVSPSLSKPYVIIGKVKGLRASESSSSPPASDEWVCKVYLAPERLERLLASGTCKCHANTILPANSEPCGVLMRFEGRLHDYGVPNTLIFREGDAEVVGP